MTIKTMATMRDDALIEAQAVPVPQGIDVRCTGLPNGPDGIGCEAPATLFLIAYPLGATDMNDAEVNPSCRPCYRRLRSLATAVPEGN